MIGCNITRARCCRGAIAVALLSVAVSLVGAKELQLDTAVWGQREKAAR